MSLLRRLLGVARSQLPAGAEPIKPSGEGHVGSRSPPPRQSSRVSTAAGGIDAKYYANLELEPGADYAQIKTAYRSLLRRYHPDRHHRDPEQSALALEITKRLNEAMDHFEKKFAREQA